ncbi:MAG: hypothetical protein LLG00_03625 [Planctomycetaceae bacterium]|nr:hypothetical protein [Planctomycetaceae bacterium]
MLQLPTALLLALAVVVPVQAAKPFRLAMEDTRVGELPSGWIAAKSGEGQGSVWRIVADDTVPGGKALAQVSADGPKRFYNLCVAKEPKLRDLDMSVAFKAVAGKIDQGGGLVWRYKDAKNYYVTRINPLENNFRLYKVVDGKRRQLATADLKVAADRWHVLRVTHRGNRIQCYYAGRAFLDVTDDTFPEAGQIGFWTKADAQTRFAALRVDESK